MGKKIFAALSVLFLLLCLTFVFFSLSDDSEESAITLTSSEEISADTDSDGDGAPDWLEEISGTDVSGASSFPYRRDVALAKNISADELLYGGPGEFTEEIVRRFLSGNKESAPVSEEEREKFISDSVTYFLEQVEKRGLPEVPLTIDNTAPREPLLKDFLLSLKKISDERQAIDALVNEIFAKNTSVWPKAERMRLACEYALATIPRSVPSEIYSHYYLVLERITYSCEALSVSLESDTAVNFFYALRLLGSGVLFAESGADLSDGDVEKKFIQSAEEIVAFLRKK